LNIRLNPNESGEIAIEEAAIRSIVEAAIKDTGDGSSKVKRSLLFGNAIQIKEGPDNKLIVQLQVTAPYGVHIPDAMREIQDGVKTALSNALGLQNVAVHVVVAAVSFGPTTADDPQAPGDLVGKGLKSGKDLMSHGLLAGKQFMASGKDRVAKRTSSGQDSSKPSEEGGRENDSRSPKL